MTMPNDDNLNKADLIKAIQALLQKGTVETQEEICAALQQQGFAVTQTKISRVLHKLGAIKMSEGEKTVYRLPTEFRLMTPNDSLRHLIHNIVHNEVLIVIQTVPGSAQLVARLLDQKKELGILGTVAGDDTIFITPESTQQIQITYQKIYKLLLS